MTVLHLPPASPVELVVARLRATGRRVHGRGGQYEAQCPAHADRRESLGIGTGTDGRALLTCHAGCTLEQIVAAVGLAIGDLFPPRAERSLPAGPRAVEFTHVYQYRDAHDRVRFEVCRTPDKQFRQRVPDGQGGYIWKTKGVEKVLYHLGEVLEAVATERTVYVVEGEKDVENLRALGLVATCNAGGAASPTDRQQKWLPSYTEVLRDAHVVVLPDADAPGRVHAQLVADALATAGGDVRVVVLPDLPPKGDVSDWLQAGGTRVQLEQLALDTPAWRVGDTVPETAPTRLPRAVRALDAPPPKPIAWLIEDLWTGGDLGMLVGDGGSFKTTAALHLACAVAGGYPVFNSFRVPTAGPALVVSAEDPEHILLQRAEAFLVGHEWDRARVLANLHLLASPDATLADPAWQRHLDAEVERLRPAVIVLDPLAELLGGDENSNTEVRPLLKYVRALAARSGAAVIFVHHAGKAGGEKRAIDRIRGASAINAAMRMIYFFDFKDDGLFVEPLKLSRAPKPSRFVLTRHVQADPANRAVWLRASLTHATARVHVETRAETFVRTQLAAAGGPLTTSDLKRLAHGTSVRAEELSIALKLLTARGVLDWTQGPRGAKQWLLTRAADGGDPSKADPGGNT